MTAPRIGVFGGINMDFVILSERLPRPGETIRGISFTQAAGGKGANQAVAAAKMGGQVTMFGHVGDDAFGTQLLTGMGELGIDCSHVENASGDSTGMAFIVVDGHGENLIAFLGGANDRVSARYVDGLRGAIQGCDLAMVQLECPLTAVARFVQIAASERVPVVLNPAPAAPLPPELFEMCAVVVPNETEVEALTGIQVKSAETASLAASELAKQGCANVLITMGAQGAFVRASDGRAELIPAPHVKSVDTVAAGDVFLGAFAVRFGAGEGIGSSVDFANHAAALSTTRVGAQPSIPTLDEVTRFRDGT